MSDPSNPTGLPPRPEPGQHPGLRQASEDLRATAREAKQAAGEAASTVAAEASAAAQTLKQEGASLLQDAQQRATETAQQGVRAGADQAQGIARAIHRAADELEHDSPQLARTIHDAAGAIDDFARGLRDRSPRDMLRAAEDMARRQPLAFFGAAALAGFAISRFARASAQHREARMHGYAADYRPAGTGMQPGMGSGMGASDGPGMRSGMNVPSGMGAGMGAGVGYGAPQGGTGTEGGTGYRAPQEGSGMQGSGTQDPLHEMGSAGTSATGPVSGEQPGYPHGPATQHDTATGAPGWVKDEDGTPRPATLSSASLGGAVSYRPRGGTENG